MHRPAVGCIDWLDDLVECTKDRLSGLLIITRGRTVEGGARLVEKARSGYLSIFRVSARIRTTANPFGEISGNEPSPFPPQKVRSIRGGANNTFDRACRRCESNAKRVLRVGRKLRKRRHLNPRADDQITGDKTTRTGLDAKMSVENELLLRVDLGMRGNHLTRTRSGTPGEGACRGGMRGWGHEKLGRTLASGWLHRMVRPRQ